MRILLINYEYPPVGAGAANATMYIGRALARQGHTPIVLTAAYGSLPALSVVDAVEVVRVRAKRDRADRSDLLEMASYVTSAAIALPRVIRQFAPEASIVFFSMPCGPLGLLAKRFANIPYVVSLRGGDVPGTEPSLKRIYKLVRPLRRLVLRRAVAVVANSEGLKSLSESADPVEVQVIPNGVDTDFFRPSNERTVRPTTFLFVGRFQDQKNLPLLLQSVADLRRRTVPPFRVVLVGDGPMRAELERRSTELGLSDVITWAGWCSKAQLLQHYQVADCFLNPSKYEGMPNAVLEAMACALPVIASDVIGNNAVVVSGETGYLVSLGSPKDYAEAMHRVVANPTLARRMGAAGRQRMESQFSWESVARQYLSLLPHPVKVV